MYPDYNTLLRFYKTATGTGSYNVGMEQAQQNILPPRNVIQVNGRDSVTAIRMSPNSSVLLMDTTQPVVWLCTSDGLGNVTPVPYDITPHQDLPPVSIESMETSFSIPSPCFNQGCC